MVTHETTKTKRAGGARNRETAKEGQDRKKENVKGEKPAKRDNIGGTKQGKKKKGNPQRTWFARRGTKSRIRTTYNHGGKKNYSEATTKSRPPKRGLGGDKMLHTGTGQRSLWEDRKHGRKGR